MLKRELTDNFCQEDVERCYREVSNAGVVSLQCGQYKRNAAVLSMVLLDFDVNYCQLHMSPPPAPAKEELLRVIPQPLFVLDLDGVRLSLCACIKNNELHRDGPGVFAVVRSIHDLDDRIPFLETALFSVFKFDNELAGKHVAVYRDRVHMP